MERRLAAILAADVVGYARLIRADEEGTLTALKALRADLIDPKIAEHHGRIVKLMGDGMLAEFPSVVDAVRAAVETQQAVAERNSDLPEDKRIEFRVGINLGDVVIDGDDIHGDGVNIAARLEGLAEPGGLCVSGGVYEQVRDRIDAPFEDMGEQEVKNIDRPVHVWRWVTDRAAVADEPTGADEPQSLPDEPSIVVLPFTNMSGDPEQEYFSDGITEDIITDLSKLSGLFVIARNSAFVYKGQTFNVATVCAELGVRFALEGSIRKASNRVRINAQLIEAERGGHLWAERYDRDLTDIFAVQDEVTANIVQALSVTLREEEKRRIGQRGTENLAAYELMLRGRELFLRGQNEDTKLAKEILDQAVEADPSFGPAYAYLAQVHAIDYVNGWSEDPQASLRHAHDLAKRGAELMPDDAHVHIALGSTFLWLRRHDEAIAEAERAVELDPNYAHGLFELGFFFQYAGRADESLDYFERAVRLDPHHSAAFLHFMAQAYFQLGRYDEAVEFLQRRLVRNPQSDSSRMLLASCYGHMNRHDEARVVWSEIKAINPEFSLDQRREVLPYKNSESFEQIVDGLHKAGLPE